MASPRRRQYGHGPGVAGRFFSGQSFMSAPRFLLACLLMTGCSALPASGPTERQVLSAENGGNNSVGFRIVDVSPSVVNLLQQSHRPTFSTMDNGGAAPRVDAIGPGDTLNISIFEVGNGIFSGGATVAPAPGESSGGSNGASGMRLPPVQVDSRGYIGLPYVGRIRAAGRTPSELAEAIRGSLRTLSQDPQVLVSQGETISNAVFVQGDVKNPGRRSLTLNHERLLDAVALSGGSTFPSSDTRIELVRAGRKTEVPLRQVETNSEENVTLRPGDRVRLVHQARSFTVFGASGKVTEIPFEAADLSLAEGVARSGGPQNERADPNAVFLFRFEPASIARNLGVAAPANVQPGAPRPVVYRLDMMDPSSYFLSQRFAMENKDLIYIANARTDRLSKAVGIIYNLAFPLIVGRQLVN